MTSTSKDGKITSGGQVLSSGEDNGVYVRDNDVEPDNIIARIPLLSSTTLHDVTKSTNLASTPECGGNSLAKHVRIILPSDSDEDEPDFV